MTGGPSDAAAPARAGAAVPSRAAARAASSQPPQPPTPQPALPPEPAPHHRRRRRRRRSHRRLRIALAFGALAVLILVIAAAGLVFGRYLPAWDEARTLRTDLEAMAAKVQDAGLEIDRPTIDGLATDLATSRAHLDHLSDLLAHDPLIGFARSLPQAQADIKGADTVVAAARDLFDAADQALAMGTRFVEIKDAQAADPASASALAQLVELMATSRDKATAAQASLAKARGRPGDRAGRSRPAARRRPGRDGPADRQVRAAARHLPHDQRATAGHAGLGRPTPLPGPDPEPGRAPTDRRLHRELRDHRVRPRQGHRAEVPGRLPARLALGLPVRQAADRAGELPARPEAALAAGRRELVARLPDQRPAGREAVRQRVRRRAHRRRVRDHHVHDR